MDDLNDKITGNSLLASEWNQPASEVQSVIESTGLVLSGADPQQLVKSVATYAAGGNFFQESGTSIAYQLGAVGSKILPPVIFEGLTVRFRATNANTTSTPTCQLGALGAITIEQEDGSPLIIGQISTSKDTTLRLDVAASPDKWRLIESGTSGLPKGYIEGLTYDRSGVDIVHDIRILVGQCRSQANNVDIVLGSQLIKQIDASWVAGDSAGGMAGAEHPVQTDKWYRFFLIWHPNGTVDAGFDDLADASQLLASATGYTEYRQIGWVRTDGSANIFAFENDNLNNADGHVWWVGPPTDLNAAFSTTSALVGVSAPPESNAIMAISLEVGAGSTIYYGVVSSGSVIPVSGPSINHWNLQIQQLSGQTNIISAGVHRVAVNFGSQVRWEFDAIPGSSSIKIITLGWFWDRKPQED